jgi:hypothetical protein
VSQRIIPMRPRKLRRLLALAAFGAMSAGIVLGDFIAWAAR